ncbi:hypothetical protein ACED96_10245 [Clostridium thermobutyricum]|uniref:Uncharacterized protein n=1 Tax=Clostridium thermobutyricum DSM 4928 TaxID=1121339 RepID=A0A1V4STV0_9CLOT|nr:hypothetical protein [Clostridium thermobutyricum]OPX47295.1 hypothetical protein CLTHE_18580 [Clostridium thermobutyricum DSM 4928]
MKYFRVNKRVLLFIGGLVWIFAAIRVFLIGKESLISAVNSNYILNFVIGIITLAIFYFFIFSKLTTKHAKRIINSPLIKHCPFAFFDVKSYIIMIFMISLSIGLRYLNIINLNYLGSFYIGIAIALFLGGILFIRNSIIFNKLCLIYKK